MLYRGEHLLDVELSAQLLACELGVVVRHYTFWDAKTTNDVLPHQVLNPVGSYLRNWFNFYPLGKVLDGHH